MTTIFRDRYEGGRQLAAHLQALAGRPNLVVLGLPRGGVPVAGEVAAALGAVLDVFVVRKIGAPGHEELAMGAVASGGVRVVHQDVVRELGVTRQMFEQATERERREVQRRERAYREARAFPELRGATVVLVDDGVATGATMLAAIYALRQLGPAAVIAAAPVMSREAYRTLAKAADQCECVAIPEFFYGLGAYYLDFGQTSDEEVRAVLHRPGPRSAVSRSFTGAVAHTKYSWPLRRWLQRISHRRGLPTDPSRDWGFTERDEVDRFARSLATMFAPADRDSTRVTSPEARLQPR